MNTVNEAKDMSGLQQWKSVISAYPPRIQVIILYIYIYVYDDVNL